MYDIIRAWTTQYTKFEVMERFGEAGVPCGAVFDSHDIFTHPQLRERGMVATVEHPTPRQHHHARLRGPGSTTPRSKSPRAPLLGQHNGEV